MALAWAGMPAQVWQPAQQAAAQVQPQCNITFDSRHGEAYTVFIDGDIVNRMPQGHVVVNNISRRQHEIVVVLRRPAEKAAVLQFLPGEENAIVNVDYDMRNEYLHLFTAPCNRPETVGVANTSNVRATSATSGTAVPVPVFDNNNEVTLVVDGMPSQMASDEEVDVIVGQLKAKTFDSDRQSLARTLMAQSLYTSTQIARIARTIDHSNNQVEFLKYAYSRCCDPRNFSRALEVLTFTSDRKKVSDYIATQR